jgi:hypothetical protein
MLSEQGIRACSRSATGARRVFLYAFDLIELDGDDCRSVARGRPAAHAQRAATPPRCREPR